MLITGSKTWADYYVRFSNASINRQHPEHNSPPSCDGSSNDALRALAKDLERSLLSTYLILRLHDDLGAVDFRAFANARGRRR